LSIYGSFIFRRGFYVGLRFAGREDGTFVQTSFEIFSNASLWNVDGSGKLIPIPLKGKHLQLWRMGRFFSHSPKAQSGAFIKRREGRSLHLKLYRDAHSHRKPQLESSIA